MSTRLLRSSDEHSLAGFLRKVFRKPYPRPAPLERRLPAELMEPRIVLSATLGPFTDTDGDIYFVKLGGAGTADVVQDGTPGPIASIALAGTTATTTLAITVKKGATGDGEVSIGEITGSTPVKAISAPKSDLV